MRKIAIVGFKGGIGKTTTCVNLGAALAQMGHKVLLIDTDTQTNVATSLGLQDKYKKNLAHVLMGKAKATDCIIKARKNLDLLPGSLDLFKAQQRMVLEMAREEIFEELFVEIGGYDYLLIDCAPSLSLLTINSVIYVDEVFIPVSMELLATSGATQFMDYLKNNTRQLGSKAAGVTLIIPTMYDARRGIRHEVIRILKKLGPRVTEPIGIDTQLSEAPGRGKTIFEHAPNTRGAKDYARLANTVATMLEDQATNSSSPKSNTKANK